MANNNVRGGKKTAYTTVALRSSHSIISALYNFSVYYSIIVVWRRVKATAAFTRGLLRCAAAAANRVTVRARCVVVVVVGSRFCHPNRLLSPHKVNNSWPPYTHTHALKHPYQPLTLTQTP